MELPIDPAMKPTLARDPYLQGLEIESSDSAGYSTRAPDSNEDAPVPTPIPDLIMTLPACHIYRRLGGKKLQLTPTGKLVSVSFRVRVVRVCERARRSCVSV